MSDDFCSGTGRGVVTQGQNATSRAEPPGASEDVHSTPTLTEHDDAAATYVTPPLAILAVDDARTRSRLTLWLMELGCRVRTTLGSEETLSVARTSSPELVVLDLTAEELRARELPRALRADTQTRLVPIVALTSGQGADPMADFPVCDSAVPKNAEGDTFRAAVRAALPSLEEPRPAR